jgi:NAD(P)-dependent dehydrogenase (short-subunit alcohol dehydrogenase family)
VIIDGKVAIVTGAAGGIGAAIAQRLMEHGASVVVSDLDEGRVAGAVASLETAAPGRVVGLAGDCSLESGIRSLVDLAVERFGPVDLYVANAGVGRGAGLDASDDDWEASIDVNLMAHVRAARLLMPSWLDRGHGYFVSTASAAGLLTQLGSPTYAVSKHAAVAFAEWLSVTYGARGIGVSCLCPMGVNTGMLGSGSERDADVRASVHAVRRAGAVMEPLDVADVVVQALATEQLLILPHPEVGEFYRRKGDDHERWLSGMRRYQDGIT